MAPTVGYATLQVIPSLRGVHTTIRQELNGRDIGQEVGADISQGVEEGFDAGGLFDNISAPMAAAGLAAGAAIGAAALEGIQTAMSRQASEGLMQAQLGLSEADAAYYGKVAGEVYAGNFGDSLDHANEAVAAVGSSLSDSLGPGSDALQHVTEQALTFAQVFGTDVAEATTVAGSAIRVGLAEDATEAFDLMTAASQKMPAGIRSELLPAVEEYGVFLAELGFTGEEAFGLLARASEGGAVQLDKAGDALKEFQILATDPASAEVLESIGLNAEKMADDVLAGGATAKGALDQIVSALLDVQDPSERAAAAVALFGTPLEDISKSQIPSFLEGLQTSGDALGDFEGSTDAAAAAVGDNLSSQLESLKRSAMTELADLMEQRVLPVIDSMAGGLETLGGFAADNIQPILLLTGAWVGLKAAAIAGTAWTAISAGVASVTGTVTTLTGAIQGLAATRGVSTMTAGFEVMKSSVAGIASAVNPVTLGFVALGAAYLVLSQRSAEAEAKMQRVQTQIEAVARAGVTGADDLERAFGEKLSESLAGTQNGFEGVSQTLNSALEETGITARELLGIIQSSDVVTGEMVTLAGELENASAGAGEEFYNLQAAWVATGIQADILTARQADLGISTDDASTSAAGLADAQSGVADATTEAVDAMEGWKTVIDEIMGVNIDFEQALIGQSEAVLALAQADNEARAAGEEWSTTLDLGTEAGQRNRQMLSDLIEGAVGVAEAYYEQTGSMDGANMVLAQQRDLFYEAATAAGFSTEGVDAYLASTNQWPTDLSTILSAEADWESLANANRQLDEVARQRIATFVADVLLNNVGPAGGPGVSLGGGLFLQRWGGITEYAAGGIHAHVGRGDLIRYAEPATGGEAFIPRLGDRNRSMSVLATAASWLDVGIIDKKRLAGSTAQAASAGTTVIEPHFHSQATDWDGVWTDAKYDLARYRVPQS